MHSSFVTYLARVWRDERGTISFGENLALKALSLLLALILWITILGLKREELKKTVLVQPLLPPGVAVVNEIPRIQFTLTGPRVLLKDVEKKLHPIRPDFSRTRERVIGFPIREDMIGELPVGVRVSTFYPPSIVIHLEEMVEMMVPVSATLTGEAAAGFSVSSVRIEPAKVTVTGPKSLFEALDSVPTEAIDIQGLSESRDLEVPLELTSTQGFQLSRDRTVKIRITVRRRS